VWGAIIEIPKILGDAKNLKRTKKNG